MNHHGSVGAVLLTVLMSGGLLVTPQAAWSKVIFYRFENFSDGYTIAESCKNVGQFVRTYQSTCTEGCCHGEDTRDVPCTKSASLNDDFRAIEITGSETVEVYEHTNYGGRLFRYRGPTKAVFPAWFWDRMSSFAVW